MRQLSDLRGAQQRTVTRMYESDALQAVLPMGAGKTASALTAFVELKRDGYAKHMLVIAPKRVAQFVWPDEPKLWFHLCGLKVVTITGTAAQRYVAMQTPADIHVIGIDNTKWLVEQLTGRLPGSPWFDLLCIDELSKFKDPAGKRAKALATITDRFRIIWGLTGTPRPNGYEDQFMPMRLLTKGRLWGRSFYKWRDENFASDYMGYSYAMRSVSHRDKLIKDINTVSITIRPEDMPDMPALNAGEELIEWVDMPSEVKPAYDRMKRHLVAQVKSGVIAAANMAVASGKLEQIVQGFLYEDESKAATRLHDVKLEALEELVEQAGGEPVLVAYHFVDDLKRLQDTYKGLRYLGAGVSDTTAAQTVALWNSGSLPIMAVHPASAGHGLNLQSGGHLLFWYGLTWSAELYDQLIKRLHRPGQRAPVFSRPILMRDTVDEIKNDRVRGKMTDQEAFNRLLKEV